MDVFARIERAFEVQEMISSSDLTPEAKVDIASTGQIQIAEILKSSSEHTSGPAKDEGERK